MTEEVTEGAVTLGCLPRSCTRRNTKSRKALHVFKNRAMTWAPRSSWAGSRASHGNHHRAPLLPVVTHRRQSFQGREPLVPGRCRLFKSLMALDELFHLVHALAYLSAGQVGLLPEQPGLSHTGIPWELMDLQDCTRRTESEYCGQVTGQPGVVLPSSGSGLHKLPSLVQTCSVHINIRGATHVTSTSHIKNRWN